MGMLIRPGLVAGLIAALMAITPGLAQAQDVLPQPEAPTAKFVGRTAAESSRPEWPKNPEAPKGAPNVVVILTDDVGFGAAGTFGGPVPTPTLDGLAKDGLRYNEFHVTAMCSPTRAALLTGRNHHDVGSGHVTESANAFDGYTSVIPRSAATIAEILKDNGYATALIGKHHNTPNWETSQAGPFDRWPTGMGFQYFYGFMGGDTSQFAPSLYEGTNPVEPPANDPNYIMERDLADHAIAWVQGQKSVAPDRPFFLYYAPSATHAPHQAPKDWIDRYKGKFDQGWDKVREETLARQKALGVIPADTLLTKRPDEIPAWDSLTPDQKAVYARFMEVYAGFLAHVDYQTGRVIQALRDMGQYDNTLIFYIEGDNGATGEGGPDGRLNEQSFMNGMTTEDFADLKKRINEIGGPNTYPEYPLGWAHAMNTPFQWCKQIASHFGGTRDGMVVTWPARIKDKGGLRSQFHHVIDVTPTILEAVGLPAPSIVNGVQQKPMAGVSMMYTFDDAKAPSTRSTQYFELFGNRAIYHDGWIAAAGPVEMPWAVATVKKSIDDIKWELYHITEDYSEANNLADKEPAKLRELQDLFWAEAARNHVLPIMMGKIPPGPPQPSLARGRSSFVFYPGTKRLPMGSALNLVDLSFSIEADVTVPDKPGNGVLITQGGRFGGYALYLLNGKLVYAYSYLNAAHYEVRSSSSVPAGKHKLGVDFKYDGFGAGKGGTATLTLDGKEIGSGRIEKTAPTVLGFDEGLAVGLDTGTPVSDDYKVPFAFNGTLTQVTVTRK